MTPQLRIRRGFGFLPNQISGLLAWYRFNTGITITGLGVSQWDDQSGNGRHLTQGTDADRPSHSSGIITGDGATENLTTSSFTLIAQPITIVTRIKQVTWTGNECFLGMHTDGDVTFYQSTATPGIGLFLGSAQSTVNNDLAVNTWGTVIAICDGASTSIQVNGGAPASGINPGTKGMNIIQLFANGVGGAIGNIAIQDAAIYSKVLSSGEIGQLLGYMGGLGA